MSIDRQLGKFEEVLSYVGGLFGILFGFIAFFVSSYSEYRYEIYVGEGAFCYDKSGRRIKENDFGIINYIFYCLYEWLKTFGCELNWKKMK